MHDARIQRFETRLLQERERSIRSLRRAQNDDDPDSDRAAREPARYSQHMADAGSQMQVEETAFLLASREGARIAQIDAALHMLRDDPDQYFTCEACGRPIEEARLEFLPWTRLCAADARSAGA